MKIKNLIVKRQNNGGTPIGDFPREFGKLTVLYEINVPYMKKRKVACICSCGKIIETTLNALERGTTTTCGCGKIKHGLTHHPLYRVWAAMKTRCAYHLIDIEDKNYEYYAGRGIKICDEWINDFKAFYDWAISAGWKKGLYIDREDNDGNYTPGNCRFVTSSKSGRNRRSTKLTASLAKGIRLCSGAGFPKKQIAEWYEVDVRTIRAIIFNEIWKVAI